MESFEIFAKKLVYEYMKMCEYKRSRPLFDFWRRTLIVCEFQTSEATGSAVSKCYGEPSGAEETKISSNDPGHMPNMSAMPVDSKNL